MKKTKCYKYVKSKCIIINGTIAWDSGRKAIARVDELGQVALRLTRWESIKLIIKDLKRVILDPFNSNPLVDEPVNYTKLCPFCGSDHVSECDSPLKLEYSKNHCVVFYKCNQCEKNFSVLYQAVAYCNLVDQGKRIGVYKGNGLVGVQVSGSGVLV